MVRPYNQPNSSLAAESSVGTAKRHAQSRNEVAIAQLRPTQMTVGYAEVLLKRQQWRALDQSAKKTFIAQHAMPAVVGPKGRYFIVDHHHLALALFEEDVAAVPVIVLANLAALDKGEFWTVMDYRQWVHPYDSRGRKHPVGDLPKTVSDLRNDSYRSLAAAVRMVGGVLKEQTPFAEFLWADFFRRRVSANLLSSDPSAALVQALQMAHENAAKHLPGWTPTSNSLPSASVEAAHT